MQQLVKSLTERGLPSSGPERAGNLIVRRPALCNWQSVNCPH